MKQFNLTELDIVVLGTLSKYANNPNRTVSYHLDGLALDIHIPRRHIRRSLRRLRRNMALELLYHKGDEHRVKVLTPILVS